jgi:excinuclease ABC subunit A
MADKTIRLRSVRVNNLKSVSLDIPHGQWLSICGVSGSGKSSLAFDALYAEGQRRYLECLAPGTRRFLMKLDKPDADLIDGLPPAIAIKSYRTVPAKTETVGTACEIVDYLRILFSQVASIICPSCQVPVEISSVDRIARWLGEQFSGKRVVIAFELMADNLADLDAQLLSARKNGFARAVIGQSSIELSQLDAIKLASEGGNAGVESTIQESVRLRAGRPLVIVDRLSAASLDSSRTRESLEVALQSGHGACVVFVEASAAITSVKDSGIGQLAQFARTIDDKSYQAFPFGIKPQCSQCLREFPPPEPRLFDFGSSKSACPHCQGCGFVDAWLREVCQVCNGDRLQPDAQAYVVEGKSIAEFCRDSVGSLVAYFQSFQPESSQLESSAPIRRCILARLEYLQSVGLDYLTLDRPLQHVSSGEAQRLQLTNCLSSNLVNMLYLLDEPSRGLHVHELPQLLQAIARLNSRPNTVVVVDHQPMMLRRASRVVEIGPAAGRDGGVIVFDGSFDALKHADTNTGHFLAGRRGVRFERRGRTKAGKKLQIFGACGNNLQNLNIDFPLGCLCVVTGVSGAGKSTLVRQTLYPAVQNQLLGTANPQPLSFSEVFGTEYLENVVLIDQTSIGRSGRSNPVTYVKAFDEIRQAFAETADAKRQQASPSDFSFNVPGGRCDKCDGDGYLQHDLQFLPDVLVKCDQCDGTRYRASTLTMKYRGLNIAEVLQLTVREAFTFFRGQPKVQGKLKALIDVGLDYLRLGQPANTLSGGESQRLKLAHNLNSSNQKRTLFIMEEPTIGLHPVDVTRLLDSLDSLIAVGHSIVIVEHNLQVIKNADWIIDLGPGPGAAGGRLVACGPPEQLEKDSDSITARYLRSD